MKISDARRTVLITAAGLLALALRLVTGAGTTLELAPSGTTSAVAACDHIANARHGE